MARWKKDVTQYMSDLGKTKVLDALTASEALQDGAIEQQRMIKAENEGVARSMGWPLSARDDDVRQTILGDNVRAGMGMKEIALLGVLGLGALALYKLPEMLQRPETPVEQPQQPIAPPPAEPKLILKPGKPA